MEIKLGYESDYYFRVVDRINPWEGFVVNQSPFPVKRSSNFGLGGGFISLNLIPDDPSYACISDACCIPCLGAFYGGVDVIWFQPIANNGDLEFATLIGIDGSRRAKETNPQFGVGLEYHIGCKYGCNNVLSLSYFHFKDDDSRNISAGAGESIESINSSGNAFIQYAQASSKVTYDIDQVDLEIGRVFLPTCYQRCQFFIGAQYASVHRKMNNEYSGGVPDLAFQTKQGVLKSDFHGAGPLFGTKVHQEFCKNFFWKTDFSLGILLGKVKSTLDQQNQGTLGNSSNTLRTPRLDRVVPVVDVSTSLCYSFCIPRGPEISFELGYKYKEYFRAVNLVYPNFLTGLQQRNSDLAFHGPYFAVHINSF